MAIPVRAVTLLLAAPTVALARRGGRLRARHRCRPCSRRSRSSRKHLRRSRKQRRRSRSHRRRSRLRRRPCRIRRRRSRKLRRRRGRALRGSRLCLLSCNRHLPDSSRRRLAARIPLRVSSRRLPASSKHLSVSSSSGCQRPGRRSCPVNYRSVLKSLSRLMCLRPCNNVCTKTLGLILLRRARMRRR